ncbi:MAG: hypothetical protein JNJ61_27140 [Anaerolineae bacterium]|nr:hypothetical protein [Anaerolineae bacterium]
MNSEISKLMETVSEADGIQAPYGGGDYTITAWENMDGGYDLVFARSNSGIAHDKEHYDTASDAVARALEFNADPRQWYPVVFGEC